MKKELVDTYCMCEEIRNYTTFWLWSVKYRDLLRYLRLYWRIILKWWLRRILYQRGQISLNLAVISRTSRSNDGNTASNSVGLSFKYWSRGRLCEWISWVSSVCPGNFIILHQIRTCPLFFTSPYCIIQDSSFHFMRYSLTYWCLLHISNTRWFKYDRDWFVCKQAALRSSCPTLREWSHNLHPPSWSG